MSNVFVSLAEFFRPIPSDPAIDAVPPPEPIAATIPASLSGDQDEALRAARRFHAALSDALDATVAELVPVVAREVLARELRLAPADLRAIAGAALHRFESESVLAIRAHPSDLAALEGLEFEKIADLALEPGDVILHLRSGTIDLTLAARLEALLGA